VATAEGLGEEGAVMALQRGVNYLQNLQAVQARESFPWDSGDLVSREASAVKKEPVMCQHPCNDSPLSAEA